MKQVLIKMLAVATLTTFMVPLTAAARDDDRGHGGEERYLAYSIEYLEPKGVTTVSETGIAFVPFSGLPTYDGTILSERYFGDYPLYFSNTRVDFRVHIKNTGKRTFQHLGVGARQELLNIDGRRGESFSDVSRWVIEELRGGEEVTLEGSVFVPIGVPSGLDQTHLRIFHTNSGDDGYDMDEEHEHGSIIINDSQAGIWCPVSSKVI